MAGPDVPAQMEELAELAERLPAVIELLETARMRDHSEARLHFTGCEFSHADCLARRALRELHGTTDIGEDLEW